MDREGSNRNEFETFTCLLFIYPSIDISSLPASWKFVFPEGCTLSNFTFFLGVCARFLKTVISYRFFPPCKMFFSSSILTRVQKSNREIGYSSILERCYIVRGKRCWYRSIKSPEGKEFSQFTGVIVTKRFTRLIIHRFQLNHQFKRDDIKI